MLLSLACWSQGDNKRDYSLVLSLLALLLMLVIFCTFHYRVGLMYLRGWITIYDANDERSYWRRLDGG